MREHRNYSGDGMSNEQALLDRVNRKKLVDTNQVIRNQLSAGVSVDDIAKQVGGEGLPSKQILASMSVAETHHMEPGEAFSMLPSILSMTYGKKFNLDDIVKNFFTQSEEFQLPYKSLSLTQLAEQVKEEEKFIPKFSEEAAGFLPEPPIPVLNAGAFNQAFMLNGGIIRKSFEQRWFGEDISKEQFFKGMLKVETEEERDKLRSGRFMVLVGREQERIQKLKDTEARLKTLKTDAPGVWQSKLNAWEAGSGRVAQSALDVSSEMVGILGKAFDSSKLDNISKGLNDWARAYHKAIMSTEFMTVPVNTFDEMANSFLQNAPYSGIAIVAAIFSPDKVTPFAIFGIGAAVEGSEIKQQSLDKGLSEKSSRVRGWIGGTVNGIIEAIGGGAAKYDPRKFSRRLIDFPGKLTKVVLTEIFREEIPQETISMLLTEDTPRLENGEIDWERVVDRFAVIARDTAFTSAILTNVTTVTNEAVQWDRKRLLNKQVDKAIHDAVGFIASEQEGSPKVTISDEIDWSFMTGQQEAIVAPGGAVGAITEAEAVEAQEDEIVVETTPEAEEIEDLIDETPVYDIVREPDGLYTIIDLETQEEIMTGLKRKKAKVEANALNSGFPPPRHSYRAWLPTSEDIETLSHTKLLRAVFKKVSKFTRKAVADTTKSIIGLHKDLAGYTIEQLNKLDISEGKRNTLLRKLASAKTDKQVQAMLHTVLTFREQARHIKAEANFKKLRRFINRASRKRISNGGIHFNIYETLTELLNNYTTLSPKILNTLKRAETHIDKLRENVSERFESAYAETMIPKKITGKLKELAGTPLKEMNADQIEELNNTLKHYLKLNQTYSNLLNNRKMREAKNYLDNAVANIKLPTKERRGKRFTPKRGVWKKMWDTFGGIHNDDIYTIANRIWGKFNPITQLVINSRRQQIDLTMKYTDMLRGIMGKAEITIDQLKEWSPAMAVFSNLESIKQKVGRGVQLQTIKIGEELYEFTIAELMSLAMHSRNTYNITQIARNGIATRDERIGQLGPEAFSEMMGIIENDPAIQSFVESLESFYLEMSKDMNNISRKLEGRDIANVENYFHVEYVSEGGVIGTEYTRGALLDEDGRLKPRTSSKRPVIIRDIFEVITEDVAAISQFVGMAEGIQKLRMLANYGPFRQALRDANAEHILKSMDERIHSVQITRQPFSGALEKAVTKIDRGVAQAVLLNPAIWVLQPFSMVLYATEADMKYMKAITPKLGASLESLFNDNWSFYRARKEGLGAAKSLASPSTTRKMFVGSGNINDKAMAGLHKGDLIGVSRAGQVTIAEMSDPQLTGKSRQWWKNYGVMPSGLDFGSESYWEAFNDRADYLVTLTQPMFFAENKSHFTNSDNPLVRSLARFRGFIDQIGRIIRRSISDAKYGNISRVEAMQNIGIAVTLVSIVSATVKYLWDLLLGKKKEEGDFMRAVLTGPLAVIPFVGYPAKQIADALLGGKRASPEVSTMPLMLVNSILKHSWQTARGLRYAFDDEFIQSGPNAGEKKSEQYLKDGIQGVMSDFLMLHGVPTRTIERIDWWK